MNYVKQEDTNGCTLACMAMLLNKTYHEMKEWVNDPKHDWSKNGGDEFYMFNFMSDLGIPYMWKTKYGHNCNIRPVWPPEPFADWMVMNVQCYEGSGGHHIIVDRNYKIYDPYFGEGVKKISDYAREPYNAVGFNQKDIDAALTNNKSTLY